MDFVKNLASGNKDGEQTGTSANQAEQQQQSSSGGGLMGKLNNMAGGGAAGEKNEDAVDKGMHDDP